MRRHTPNVSDEGREARIPGHVTGGKTERTRGKRLRDKVKATAKLRPSGRPRGLPLPAGPSAASGGPSPPRDPLGMSSLTSLLRALKSCLSSVLLICYQEMKLNPKDSREASFPPRSQLPEPAVQRQRSASSPDGRQPRPSWDPRQTLGVTPDPSPLRPALPAAHQVLPTRLPPPCTPRPPVPTASDWAGLFRPLSASEAFRKS